MEILSRWIAPTYAIMCTVFAKNVGVRELMNTTVSRGDMAGCSRSFFRSGCGSDSSWWSLLLLLAGLVVFIVYSLAGIVTICDVFGGEKGALESSLAFKCRPIGSVRPNCAFGTRVSARLRAVEGTRRRKVRIKNGAAERLFSFGQVHSLMLITCEAPQLIFCAKFEIMRSGDVSSNPGPTADFRLRSGGSAPRADGPSRINKCSPNVELFYGNVRSIRNKTLDLQVLLNSKVNVDVVALCETWLKPDFGDAELLLPDSFEVFRQDRLSHAGGVLLAIRKVFSPLRIPLAADTTMFDIIAVSCTINSRSICFLCVYRPPGASAKFSRDLLKAITSCVNSFLKFDLSVIVGDFNFRLSPADDGSVQPTDVISKKYFDSLEGFGFTQLVKGPTREGATLDLVFATNDRFVKSVSTVDNLPCCDHDAIQISLALPRPFIKVSKQTFFHMNSANKGNLEECWSRVPWGSVLSGDDINDIWSSFLDFFWAGIRDSVPSVVARGKNRDPWITKELVHLANKKRTLFKRMRATKSPGVRRKYREIGNLLRSLTRSAFACYQANLFNRIKEAPKLFWAHVRARTLIAPPSPLFLAGQSFTNVLDCGTAFAGHFARSLNFSAGAVPRTPFVSSGCQPSLVISPKMVEHEISSLRSSVAPGADNISAAMLKLAPVELSRALAILFNASLRLSMVPDDWRSSRIVPIYKNAGARSDIKNYRPISLTSLVSKLLEAIILKSLSKFCVEHAIIPDNQHGFRANRSCISLLTPMYHDWSLNLDRRSPVETVVVTLDWEKAFDRVPHGILLAKLRALNFDENLVDWISSFLFNRSGRVAYRGVLSDSFPLLAGVPQGSIISPLLFNLFLSDLPPLLRHCKSLFYADDCTLYHGFSGVQSVREMQSDLDTVSRWAAVNGMELNLKKCAFMVVTRRRSPQLTDISFVVNGSRIVRVFEVKILGIIFMADLKWSRHVDLMCRKARRVSALVLRSFRGNQAAAIFLFNSLVRPILEYGATVWDPSGIADRKRVESVQRSFTKVILSSNQPSVIGTAPLPSYEERLSLLGLLSLVCRRRVLLVIQLFKFFTGSTWLEPLASYVSFNSRHSTKVLVVPFARCVAFQTSFFVSAARCWNRLPVDVRLSPTVGELRRALFKAYDWLSFDHMSFIA